MKIQIGRNRKERGAGRSRAGTGKRLLAGYMAALLMFTTYVALDTFVITRVYGDAEQSTALGLDSSQDQSQTDSGNAISGQDGVDDSIADDGNGGATGNSRGGFGDFGGDGSSGDSMGGPSGHGHGNHGPGNGPHGGPHGKSSGSGSSSNSGSSNGSSGLSGSSSSGSDSSSSGSSSASTGTYSTDNVNITMKEYRQNDTTIYVADVQVSSPEYLRTALAQGAYGRNVTAKTSETASAANAILAINGDYYGAHEKGYVIRNGKLYRNTSSGDQEDLVIYNDGSFKIINESSVTAEQLIADGAVQTLSFGPALVQNGQVTVTEGQEVGRAMASNPRTAIGIIDECHYVFVVSDGRTSESTGLSLYQLAQFMDSLGVETAYNLDGGGSSTMYFNGQVVNNPTTGGSNIRERSVSDIVYIAK